MADYLLPVNSKLSVEQKQRMFSIKNRMIELPENFPNREMSNECICGKLKNILHIYNCETSLGTIVFSLGFAFEVKTRMLGTQITYFDPI